MKRRPAAVLCAAMLWGAPIAAAPPSISPPGPASHLVLNGEAVRTVWGFEIYKIRLYLHEVMREAEKIIGSTGAPKRIEIVMLRQVGEHRFNSTVQQSIDTNFTAEEKQRFAGELSRFLGCFNSGSDLMEGSVILIDYVPHTGMVVKLDGRTLDTIPGSDFYHAILRLWIGKPLQKSIKDGLVGTGGAEPR